MKGRIDQVMKHYNLSATQFATEIGIQRSALSHIMSGRNKPSLDFILKMKQRFSEINTDWLLLGFGKMMDEKQSVLNQKSNQGDSKDKEEQVVKSEDSLPDEKNSYKTPNLKKISSPVGTDEDIDKIVFFFKDGSFKIYLPN